MNLTEDIRQVFKSDLPDMEKIFNVVVKYSPIKNSKRNVSFVLCYINSEGFVLNKSYEGTLNLIEFSTFILPIKRKCKKASSERSEYIEYDIIEEGENTILIFMDWNFIYRLNSNMYVGFSFIENPNTKDKLEIQLEIYATGGRLYYSRYKTFFRIGNGSQDLSKFPEELIDKYFEFIKKCELEAELANKKVEIINRMVDPSMRLLHECK